MNFAEALAHMDGEDIMLGIYDNVHDELRAKDVLLIKEKEHVSTEIMTVVYWYFE